MNDFHDPGSFTHARGQAEQMGPLHGGEQVHGAVQLAHESSGLNGTSAFVPRLRGASEFDGELFERTVAHIHQLHHSSRLEIARSMGEYLLHQYFASSFEQFESLGKKHVTFHALQKDPRVPYCATWLWYAVRVYEQFHVLGSDVARRLSLAHHRVLVPIRDVYLKYELAVCAIEQSWTRDQLSAHVPNRRRSASSGSEHLHTLTRAISELRLPPIGELQSAESSQLLRLIDALDGRLHDLAAFRARLVLATVNIRRLLPIKRKLP